MKKLSPQKEYLLEFLRDMKWHCASEWARRVKDDRTRFCELEPYMAERGYKIESLPCRGSVCGYAKCPLNKRKAVKIGATPKPTQPLTLTRAQAEAHARQLTERFDAGLPAEEVFV